MGRLPDLPTFLVMAPILPVHAPMVFIPDKWFKAAFRVSIGTHMPDTA